MLSNENSGFSLDAKVRVPSWDRKGLERLIRYCARPCFARENLRWNGPWIHYRLPKPTHTGKTFVQIEPLEFIERISRFIPYPRRHLRHYHEVFAPNSPLRKKVAASTQKRPEFNIQKNLQESSKKVIKVSFDWAKLIARIYKTDPLLCECGNKIKITSFVIHTAEIRRILKRIGCWADIQKFDPPYPTPEMNICQLLPWTEDGFSPVGNRTLGEWGPDPPLIDPPIGQTISTRLFGKIEPNTIIASDEARYLLL